MQHKLILFLLFSPVLFITILTWERVKLDESVSVSFPSKPEKSMMDDKPIWIATIDSTSKCMAMITDFEKLGVDKLKWAERLKQKETYQTIKSGMLRGSPGAVILNESITTFKGKPAYIVKMDLKGEKEDFNIAYVMNVFIETKMYSLMFMETYNNPHEADKQTFWNSLNWNKN
ncbi:hypothetical protein [Pedobacter boryungensis]|uniref:Uncharacterized protein n=1 Tax=Pedobacter boryungensis TaxID=869962 RepID=A0ABX2DAY8_9SPHI|nr:hypothetical protein [Pedobacter boryungensis]NQX31231.1 hypothetical protein [Pedobacter boryungensis]